MLWFVLGTFIGAGFGWFVGVVLVTNGLRRDIADLDAERLALDLERKKAKTDRLRGQLIKAHIDLVDRPLHLGPVHGKWGRA